MNIGTHFDYNNHITFIRSHTKIGTPHARSVQTEVNLLIWLFERSSYYSPESVSDCEQAIDTV